MDPIETGGLPQSVIENSFVALGQTMFLDIIFEQAAEVLE